MADYTRPATTDAAGDGVGICCAARKQTLQLQVPTFCYASARTPPLSNWFRGDNNEIALNLCYMCVIDAFG